METTIINSNMAIVKVKDIMPTKSNVYDIICRLGMDVDRYKISTDHTDTVTIIFEKIAADLPKFTDQEMRDIRRRTTERGDEVDTADFNFLMRLPQEKRAPSKYQNPEYIKQRKENEMGIPINRVVSPSPRMLINDLTDIKNMIQTGLKSKPFFQESYKGEISDEEITLAIEGLKGIENKYNKLLEESIISDMKMELEPYLQKANDWYNIINKYYIQEEVIDPETGKVPSDRY